MEQNYVNFKNGTIFSERLDNLAQLQMISSVCSKVKTISFAHVKIHSEKLQGTGFRTDINNWSGNIE